ncbi:MAG: transaldolase [Gemmatimonadetes bacterium]|nr:transaldolase [Gemmatimonadota bacterium]MCC6774118.1 transaldolase [Gemmatimonadaceae bacterium]
MPNRLQDLHAAGQSVWLDYIDRAMLRNGALARLIDDDALMGMTSNPTIFEKALAEGGEYDAQIEGATGELTPWQLFELIETDDVRAACDIFAGVYRQTDGVDGYVSIEVSPGVADDADATVAEARRLWATVDRPNVMVKVPGTNEGALAIRRLIAEGINVNVTLLFSIEAHARVIEAYLSGLEDRLAAGHPIDRLASVASFFVSRVDTDIDKRLDAVAASANEALRPGILALRGKAAVANARLAYRLFTQRFSGPRWDTLAAAGARVQRPLWASTSSKNPAYRDVLYVETLIGPDTINTMPPATMDAFRDHGVTARTVDMDLTAAEQHFHELEQAGISLRDVTGKLLADGLASFQKSFDTLIAGLEKKAAALGKSLVRT